MVPGTQGLLGSVEDALEAVNGAGGFPVMLKSTAGGGGMGLQACEDEETLHKAFEMVQSRGEALFKNAGVFLEKYYPAAHHIEVQVFGNGLGQVATLGERECSIQRRHQKVVEESPSPFVAQQKPELRQKLCEAAKALAESVAYGSAGTLEFLVDDQTGDFFFLEMNTRLQVEHGVTELVYDVDLVQLMLEQADAQLAGRGGLAAEQLEELEMACREPKSHAVEVRVYAENPVKNFAPSPGLLQKVEWHRLPGTRVDTWVTAGITISPNYGKLQLFRASGIASNVSQQIRCWPRSFITPPRGRKPSKNFSKYSATRVSAARPPISTFFLPSSNLPNSNKAAQSHSSYPPLISAHPSLMSWPEVRTLLSRTTQVDQRLAKDLGTAGPWTRWHSSWQTRWLETH